MYAFVFSVLQNSKQYPNLILPGTYICLQNMSKGSSLIKRQFGRSCRHCILVAAYIFIMYSILIYIRNGECVEPR